MIRCLETPTSMLFVTNSTFFFFLPFIQKFLCGGRLVFGPDVASLFLTTFLIAAPAFTFCVKMYLKFKNEKTSGHSFWFPVMIGGLVLTFLVNILASLSYYRN
jgi:palmitoyltransferase ZDHHC9/14/18